MNEDIFIDDFKGDEVTNKIHPQAHREERKNIDLYPMTFVGLI